MDNSAPVGFSCLPGGRIAAILGLGWILVIGILTLLLRDGAEEPGGFLHFIARFHVLIVHLPIGVIFLAVGMDLLSRLPALCHLWKSLPFVLWIAFLGSIGATVLGYLLMGVEDFSGKAMTFHLYFGLSVVLAVFVSLLFALKGFRKATTTGIVAAAFFTAASGHFGGAMVHEADYLTEHAPELVKPLLSVGIGTTKATREPFSQDNQAAPKDEIAFTERSAYHELVAPILEAKCTECHNENKIKGSLRLDTFETLLAGAEGSDFPTLVPGYPERSELIVRATLPSDHDEVMPPTGESLTVDELQLLRLWIAAGATVTLKIADLGDDPSIEALALAVVAIHGARGEVVEPTLAAVESIWDSLSPEEQSRRLNEAIVAAEAHHFTVRPVSAEEERLRVDVVNAADAFGDEQLTLLEPIADQIIWLDLAKSQVTDEGMKTVAKMRALQKLHLENTRITDLGIARLGALTHLEYLNLYGTRVGNEIFETLATFPHLKKLYVWQTDVDPAAASAFERRVNLQIETGTELLSAREIGSPGSAGPK